MDPEKQNKLGRTNLYVSSMGFGAAPIGNIFKPIPEKDSEEMINTAWNEGVRYFDTAPMYGHGLSESRCGYSLRWKKREEFVLSTKVGRILRPKNRARIDFHPWVDGLPFEMQFDYSYDGTMRSFEDSLQRLGLEKIDIAFIHDIDSFIHGPEMQKVRFKQAMNGGWKALEKLRSEGLVSAVGVGVNEWEVCHEALKTHDFDCFLLAGRYTLLEQDPLDSFFPLCEKRDIAVILGGCFNSGILATGARVGAKYNYSHSPNKIVEKALKIEAICNRYSVPLPAAALQFVLAHPVIPSVAVGTRNTEQLTQNLKWMKHTIPEGFWTELKHHGLIRAEAPTPS